MNTDELTEILRLHSMWLRGEPGGARTYLSGAYLNGANLSRAYLSGANLNGADLSGANLSGANLNGAMGNMIEVKSLQIDEWCITYTCDTLTIGCQTHTIPEWFNFTSHEISKMDDRAISWWNKYRDLIKMIIETCPAIGVER